MASQIYAIVVESANYAVKHKTSSQFSVTYAVRKQSFVIF